MHDGTNPSGFGRQIAPPMALPNREAFLGALLLLIRLAAAGAIVAAVVWLPAHLSDLWRLALASSGEDPESASSEFILYLGVVRRDPMAWHATCVVLNGLIAGALIRLGSREGPLSSLFPALGVGILGAVLGEWLCGGLGILLPVAVTIQTVGTAFLAATAAIVVAWFIAKF